MRVPTVLGGLVLVGAGLFLPAAAAPLQTRPPGVIGMSHEGYEVTGVANAHEEDDGTPEITIRRGETLTFQNDSRWIHIVGPGDKGLLTSPGHGSMTPRKMMEENQVYTTPPWTIPGTFLITCTVHPEMNAKVVVLP